MGLIALRGIDHGWLRAYPTDFSALRGVANVDLADWGRADPIGHAGSAAPLGQAEAVDRLVSLASLEAGNLAGPVRDLGTSEELIGKVGDGLPFLVLGGLGLPGMVHEDHDDPGLV